MRKFFSTRRRLSAGLLVAAAVIAAFLAFAPRRVHAQLDAGNNVLLIYQSGQVAGMIYVPLGVGTRELYLEHWVLFPNYVYPSGERPTRTDIVPDPRVSYENEAAFFRAVPWGPGFRYVKVTAHDTTQLPPIASAPSDR